MALSFTRVIQIDIKIDMSSASQSEKSPKRDRSNSEGKPSKTKLFITNLDGQAEPKDLQVELKKMFEKYGEVESIVAKKNRNGQYSFAFAVIKQSEAAAECVKNCDRSYLGGKQIKVEFQDDTKRRKDSNKGCYTCGKMGHFSRQCKSARNDDSRDYRRRDRSRDRSEEDRSRRKHKKRYRSPSSDRDRNRSPKGKRQRKDRDRSKDRDQKKRKHKKSYSSDS